eukprot:TsM_000156600 transcript=TsM_000156600 gene=TsM_000156600
MRVKAYKREASFFVEENQNEALNTTMCILQNYGPMGFLIQEENKKQKFKVFIGERHTCSCKLFSKANDLCKHICWILLKKFRLDRHDPMSWQSGLCEREISILLERHLANTSRKVLTIAKTEQESASGFQVKQRGIETNDICPICQDEFLCHQRFPVTFCRKGCGNNVHIKCMKVWKDHQIKERNLDRFDVVSCPMCRGEFSKLGDLVLEITLCENYFAKTNKVVRNTDSPLSSITRDFELTEKHNVMCTNCHCLPIIGRLYCTSDGESFLNIDKANVSLSASEALTKPLCRKELGRIAKWVIKVAHTSLLGRETLGKTGKVGAARGLLTPGRQCRICLMHFCQGEEVRKLFGCNHVFHTRCVDQWLLHVSGDSEIPTLSHWIEWEIGVRPTRTPPLNAGDILKTSSFSGAARNSCVNGEARRSHRDSQMYRGRDELSSITPTLEVKSAALCRRSSTNVCTKINSSGPLRPLCKRTQVTPVSV